MQLLDIDTLKQWQRASVCQPTCPDAKLPRLGLSIAFVDSRVESTSQIMQTFPRQSIGVRLSRNLDGILQITGVLQYLHAVDGIYIVGQGEGDCYWLGNACIRVRELSKYQKFLETWRACCPQGQPPIWLYSDPATIQTMGHFLAQQFHQLTQCPVVALEWGSQASIKQE